MSDLANVAASGEQLATLRALRDRLAEEIDLTKSARDVASLSKQLVEVLREIEELSDEGGGELADLIALPGMG